MELSPAFDIVPNATSEPRSLAMQLCDGRWDISANAILVDWKFFGFNSLDEVKQYKAKLIEKIQFQSQYLSQFKASREFEYLLRVRAITIIKLIS